MTTGPIEDDQAGDITQEDLADLDGPEVDEDDEDGDAVEYVAPTKDEHDKLLRKIARQEARITKLVGGRKPAGKGGTAADQALLKGLAKDEESDDEGEDAGEVTRWRTIAAQQSAATQLAAAGFQGTAKQAARLTRMLDLASAEPDRSGVFDFEDEIEELMEEYPTLFGTVKAGRAPAPKVRTAASSAAPAKDPSRKTSDDLLRGAGYR